MQHRGQEHRIVKLVLLGEDTLTVMAVTRITWALLRSRDLRQVAGSSCPEDQIAKASPANATASRRVTGSSTASSEWPRRRFWTNACPRRSPDARVLLAPAHGTKPRLETTVVSLDAVVAYLSVRCHAAGSSSSSTCGYLGARSVTTSTGASLVVPIARSKDRWAASAAPRADTSTSITWPSRSIARET